MGLDKDPENWSGRMQILGYTGYVLGRDRVPSKWLVVEAPE